MGCLFSGADSLFFPRLTIHDMYHYRWVPNARLNARMIRAKKIVVEVDVRECRSCREVKPKNEFYEHSRRCKACCCKRTREGYRRRKTEQHWTGPHLCSHCHEMKEPSAFYHRRQICIDCHSRQGRSGYLAGRDARRLKMRAHTAAQTIPEIVPRLLAQQGGRCAICATVAACGSLHLDHCLKTGGARGLLCRRCSDMLRNAGDDARLLRLAAEYVGRDRAGA